MIIGKYSPDAEEGRNRRYNIRDGFQHCEIHIHAGENIYGQEMIWPDAGKLEVTNLGNPKAMPQFKMRKVMEGHASDEFKKTLRKSAASMQSKDITLIVVTIREAAVDRAIENEKKWLGPTGF